MKTTTNNHSYHYFSIVVIFLLVAFFTGCEQDVKTTKAKQIDASDQVCKVDEGYVKVCGQWRKSAEGYDSSKGWAWYWGNIYLSQKNGKIWGYYSWERYSKRKIKGHIDGTHVFLEFNKMPYNSGYETTDENIKQKSTYESLEGEIKSNGKHMDLIHTKVLEDGQVVRYFKRYSFSSDTWYGTWPER